jgi:hypothetical protein
MTTIGKVRGHHAGSTVKKKNIQILAEKLMTVLGGE